MPIAIYRHLKLTAAIPKQIHPVVVNFQRRQMHALCIDQEPDGTWTSTISFTTLLEKRQELRLQRRELWRINNGIFTTASHYLRNGCFTKKTPENVVPPAFTSIWTQNGDLSVPEQQFAEEFSSRVVAEKYLYQNVPNPEDFKIVSIDFDPAKALLDRPLYMSHLVRSLREVERAAITDRSEDAKKWAALFFP